MATIVRRAVTEDEELEIITAYQNGDTTPAIEKQFGISVSALYTLLDKHGVERRQTKKVVQLKNEIAEKDALIAELQTKTQESPVCNIDTLEKQLEIIMGQLDSIIRILS